MSTLASDKVFQPTDLRRDRAFIDEARQHGAARLRDTDGVSYLMVPERDYGDLAEYQELAQTARILLVLDRRLDSGRNVRELLEASPWSWLSVFDEDDIRAFITDVAEATVRAVEFRDFAATRHEIDAWRESARALADPERRAALSSTIEPAELAEIAPE